MLFYTNRVLPDYTLTTTLLCLFANRHGPKVFPFITRFNPAAFKNIFPNSRTTKDKMYRDIHLCQSLLCSYHLFLPNLLPSLNTPSIFLHPSICDGFQSISSNLLHYLYMFLRLYFNLF